MSELDTARHTGILPHGPKHQKLTVSLASCGPDRRWPRSNVNKRSTSILSSPTTSSDTHTTFLTTSHILTHSSEHWTNSAVYSARSSEYPTVIGATNLSYMSGTHTSLSFSLPYKAGIFSLFGSGTHLVSLSPNKVWLGSLLEAAQDLLGAGGKQTKVFFVNILVLLTG